MILHCAARYAKALLTDRTATFHMNTISKFTIVSVYFLWNAEISPERLRTKAVAKHASKLDDGSYYAQSQQQICTHSI